MKKNIYIFITALMLGNSLISCKKNVMDTQPYDRIPEATVWATKANAETFIFATYGIMDQYAFGINLDAGTTNILTYDYPYNDVQAIFTETLDRFSDQGFNNWNDVRRCNQIIEKVASSTGIAEPDKKPLIAEGKFLRAASYFAVARKIGRIVWIDKVLKPDEDLLLKSTATPTESYNHIIKDLEEAYIDLPNTKTAGRANKYVAAALLSEVCLQAVAYENYPKANTPNASDPLIDKAIKYANIVINDGGYNLVADYGSMFNDVNPKSEETILANYVKAFNTIIGSTPMQMMIPSIGANQLEQYGGTPMLDKSTLMFSGWVQQTPTYNLSNEYLVIDKNDPTKALPWNKTSQYLTAMDENVTIPTSVIPSNVGETAVKTGKIKAGSNENIWNLTNKNRDARWDASILSDSSVFYGATMTTVVKGNATRYLKSTGLIYYIGLTNLYWRKGIYTNASPGPFYSIPTDYHYMMFRLGRVYLNLAEAYLLKGDLANAKMAFNKTRTVHGKLPPSLAANLTEAWTDYKRERRVDLTLENDYYWSLLRWGRYGGNANAGNASGATIPELTEVPEVMDISKDRKSYKVLRGAFFGQNNVRVFNSQRRYLFPISQGLIDNNPKFGPQNAGW